MWKLVFAIVLIMHGIGHIMGVMAAWTTVPSPLQSGHWLLSSGVTMTTPIGRMFGLLWLLAMVGFVVVGIGVLANQTWWPALALASSVISLVAVVPWFNLMPLGSAVGAVLVDVLVIIMLVTPWGDQLLRAIR